MKVIDLLNKIANGEKLPKKIKTDNGIYILDNSDGKIQYWKENEGCTWYMGYYIENDLLDYEIEIIEEDNKIEKISNKFYFTGGEEELAYKINEIIDKLNNMEKNE